MAINPANWTTRRRFKTDPSFVSGGSPLSNFPLPLIDENIHDDIYADLDLGTHSLNLVASSSQHASISDASQSGLDGMTDLSVEAWVKLSSIGVFHTILSKYDTSIVGNRAYRLYIDTTNKINFSWSDGTITGGQITDDSVFSDKLDRWVHVAATVDTSTSDVKIYINGILVSSTQNSSGSGITSIGTGSATFRVGARDSSGSPGLYLDGIIKNVRIFSDVRTDVEIAEGMNSVSITDANLEGEWNLNNDYTDSSGNGNTLTSSGSPTFSTKTPLAAGQLRFTTNSDGSTEVPFKIVSAEKDGSSYLAVIWIKIPSLSHNTSNSIYIWSGNTSASFYSRDDTHGSDNVWSNFSGVWHLNESSNNRFDSTANRNDLTDNNTVGSSGGKIGLGADFEADNAEYLSRASEDLTNLNITGDISVYFWFNPESLGVLRSIISRYSTTGGNRSYRLVVDSDDKFRFNYSSDGGTSNASDSVTDDVQVSSGVITHHALTVDVSSQTFNFYKNGASEPSTVGATSASSMYDAGDYGLGARVDANAEFLDGILNEVRVYAGILSSDWIATEYAIQNDPASFWTQVNSDERSAKLRGVQNQQHEISAKAKLIKSLSVSISALGNIILPTFERTQSINAKARILPPKEFVDEINKTVRNIGIKIEVQWDGIEWIDESTYFLSARASEKMTGSLGEGLASTLDIEVDNTTERFTPDNMESPLFDLLKPRTSIRISIVAGGHEVRMFTGYIKNIHPDQRTRVCSFDCFDNQVQVYNQRANGVVYEDYRTDQLMEVLSGLSDVELENTVLDQGKHIVNFGYFEDRNVWPIMGEIAVAERGRVFFDRQGRLVFWNRDRLHNRPPIFTITQEEWITEMDYSVAEHEIKNVVIVKAAPRASAGLQVVWSSGNAEFLNPYSDTLVYVPAGGVQQAFLEMEDPCTLFITPIQYVDFEANSAQDSSGDDLTTDIEITDFINYGNAVFVEVTNNGAEDAYLTKFQIRGNPVPVLKWIKVTAIDQPSVDRYFRQEFEVENHFIMNEESATSIADEELRRRKEAINLFRIDIIGIPYLLVGDVINVEYRKSQFREFLIESIDWTFDEGGFNEKLTLTNPYKFPTVKSLTAKARIE